MLGRVSNLRALLLPAALALALAAGGASAADRSVTVSWDPPVTFAGPGNNCAEPGAAIGADDLARLQYQVRWRVGATAGWSYGTTAGASYVIEGVPAGSTIEVEVGAYLPGGSVLCWESATLTVPVPAIGPCQRLRLSTE